MQSTNRGPRRPWGRKKRRATMMVIAAIGEVVAIGISGLSIDTGHVCVAKAELQRSADAGALASASVMLDMGDLNDNPVPYYVDMEARAEAVEYVEANPCRGKTLSLPQNTSNATTGDLVLGCYTSDDDSFDPSNDDYNSAELRVRRDDTANGRLPLYFGPLFGVPSASISSGAAAFIETNIKGFQIEEGDGATCKVMPFAIQIDLWNARLNDRIDDYAHDPDNQTVGNGGDGIWEVKLFPEFLAPGNFGTVDIGPSNNSTKDLARQILYGPNANDFSYLPNNSLELDENGELILEGDTGISAGCKDELASIEGQPRIILLYSTMGGNGNNAEFTIVGFVGVTVLDSLLTGAMKNKHITVQPCYTVDPTAIGGGANGTTSKYIRKPPRLRKKKL